MMTANNGNNTLDLNGNGAAYIRVSTEEQETKRQHDAVQKFAAANGVTIKPQNIFVDEGWARDKAAVRPEFNKMLQQAEAGRIQWIVVDQLDRFGAANPYKLAGYVDRLIEADCKLLDVTGKEYTNTEDIAPIMIAVQGQQSMAEQTSKSRRVLGGKVAKARDGEWQGGPPLFCFDVVCYSRSTNKELWRVVFEARNQRLRVYPNGDQQRFDGTDVKFTQQPKAEVLRVAPSKDKAKVRAAVNVFERYAQEDISFTQLAHDLNALGITNSYGGKFQSHHVRRMLADPLFTGYYTWNRSHVGKFNRYADGKVEGEFNYDQKHHANKQEDWVQSSSQLFKPLVKPKVWQAVQNKLANHGKRTNNPRTAGAYLSGLVHCGTCGSRMVTLKKKPTKTPDKDGYTTERYEYYCGTYHKAVREGTRKQCECKRNGVYQDVLEQYLQRYLQEAGHRLQQVLEAPAPDLKGTPLQQQYQGAHTQYQQAMHHVKQLVMTTDPNTWEQAQDNSELRAAYQQWFDTDKTQDEIDKLDAQHTQLVEQFAELTSQRAKDKANRQLAKLDASMTRLEQQLVNWADVAEDAWHTVKDTAKALQQAQQALAQQKPRQLTQQLRGVLARIECKFTNTGKTGGGWGSRNSQLAEVVFYPLEGETAALSPDGKGTILYANAHSCM